MNSESVSILIIYTGGTIGMLKDPSNGSLKPFDFNKIIDETINLYKKELS